MFKVDRHNWSSLLYVTSKAADPAVQRLFEEIKIQRATIKGVSKSAGVNRKTMECWKFKSIPNIINLRAALNVMGLDLNIVRLKDEC